VGPESKGPVGTAVRKVYCCDSEYILDHGKIQLLKGYLLVSVPIIKFGKVIGVVFILKRKTFDEEEVALLEEATSDVAFALENFEKR
jgi:GAF domain-containing protein